MGDYISKYVLYRSGNIHLRSTIHDRQWVSPTVWYFFSAMSFLKRYFGLKRIFPSIRVVIAPNRHEFDKKVRAFLKVAIESPSHPSRIGQSQKNKIVVLSPNAYKRDSMYRFRVSDFRRLITHELSHIFEEYLSPDIENVPRWWGEGLAVYLSRQWRWEDEFRSPFFKALQSGTIPTFAEIEGNTRLSYIWGWSIVCYLNETYNKEMIINAIMNCRNGEIFKAMKISSKALETSWRKWLIKFFLHRRSILLK